MNEKVRGLFLRFILTRGEVEIEKRRCPEEKVSEAYFRGLFLEEGRGGVRGLSWFVTLRSLFAFSGASTPLVKNNPLTLAFSPSQPKIIL